MFFDVLQLIGGFILSFGYIPQIAQILKTKSAVDLNIKSYIMMFTGILFMEVYAVNLLVKGAGWAFLFTNTISLIGCSIIIALILKYGKADRN
ncbi:MAG: hypothetical protein K0R09_1475 [Clostridiales bacterium]|jgi:MtN3 and saliva related transmembrane protein|nr:hypothetical protein [Clostridiales bacterium]